MLKITSISIIIFFLFLGCSKNKDAELIINESINYYGGKNYNNLKLNFNFRDKEYTISTNETLFEYKSINRDSNRNTTKDILNNISFKRTINDSIVKLNKSELKKYSNALNSVVYFALIPSVLKDPAVILKYIEESEINNSKYHVIKVTFNQEGGGEDFEDSYFYWIKSDTYQIDYLAYTYKSNGGGTRIRKSFNQQKASGIIVQDYENFKPINDAFTYEKIKSAIINSTLEKVSEIKIEIIN